MTNKTERLHDHRVHRTVNNPRLIGLDGVVLSAQSVHLWTPNGRLLSEIDGLFINHNHKLTLEEYKTNDRYRATAVEQLDRAEEYLDRYHIPVMIALNGVRRKLYVHGKDYETEEI
jgi:hypothetical protein